MQLQVQKQGGIAAFIDAEHAFDATYASNLGKTDELLISQPIMENKPWKLQITNQVQVQLI